MQNRIRFSIIDYLNALPLNMAFKDGLFDDQADLIFDYPSQCADNLAAGRADVGLISSIEYQRIPDLLIAPEICIASREEVRSVLLLTTRPLDEVRVVALDRFSRSSVALLRILFQRKYGHDPRFITMTPGAHSMLSEADAALIIGDAALHLDPGNYRIIDLASEWYGETGLPFVFAFWAISRGVQTPQTVADMLLQARNYGLEQLETNLPRIRERWNMAFDDIRHYFSQNIHFVLGDEEVASLDRFYRYAEEAGLIPHVRPITFT